jgi:hypothetical protein
MNELALDSVRSGELRAYLNIFLTKPSFSSSVRRVRLLRYLVERTLAGEGEQITEYSLAMDVFEKPASFDSALDSIVRTEMSRLRQKLKEYYAGDCSADPILITLPARSYVPAFTFCKTEVRSRLVTKPISVAWTFPSIVGWNWFAIGLAAAICVAIGVMAQGKIMKNPSPAAARSAAVQVNGVCQVGNCFKPDTVGFGGALVTNFDFIFTLSNTDRYRVLGKIVSTNTSRNVLFPPFSVTYLGNALGTPTATDVLTIDLLQNFEIPIQSGGVATKVYGSFDGPIAGQSSIRGQLFYGSLALPPLGPFSPPQSFSASTSATFSGIGDPVLQHFRRVMTFGAGSGVGAQIRSSMQ